MLLVMTIFCFGAGALLAWVHSITAVPIARAEATRKARAVEDVLPPHDNNPLASAVEVAAGVPSGPATVYPAFVGGKFVGAAATGISPDGFSGEIQVLFGFDADGKVHGYQVLAHSETPGLGAKMQDWFRDPHPHRSVIGIDPAATTSKVAKDGGDIDGITAATITSRAFIDAMQSARQAFDAYCSQLDNNPEK